MCCQYIRNVLWTHAQGHQGQNHDFHKRGTKNKETVNGQNTWVIKQCVIYSHGLICSFSSPAFPIPSLIAHHASVYLVQLLGTECGQVGRLLTPVLLLLKPVFQPSSFSLSFSGWTGIKKLSGTVWFSWQKKRESVRESCPCPLLQTTCSFTQKTLREKPQTEHHWLFFQSETSMSVFHFENFLGELSPYLTVAKC